MIINHSKWICLAYPLYFKCFVALQGTHFFINLNVSKVTCNDMSLLWFLCLFEIAQCQLSEG